MMLKTSADCSLFFRISLVLIVQSHIAHVSAQENSHFPWMAGGAEDDPDQQHYQHDDPQVEDFRSPEDVAQCKQLHETHPSNSTTSSWISALTGCHCECTEGVLLCIRQCAPRLPGQVCRPLQKGQCCATCTNIISPKKPVRETSSVCVENETGIERDNRSLWRDPAHPCSLCHCQDGKPHCTEPLCHRECPALHLAEKVTGTCCDFNCPWRGDSSMPTCTLSPPPKKSINTPSSPQSQYHHGEVYIKQGPCVHERCQCLQGEWHCSVFCEPVTSLNCPTNRLSHEDPLCCRKCLQQQQLEMQNGTTVSLPPETPLTNTSTVSENTKSPFPTSFHEREWTPFRVVFISIAIILGLASLSLLLLLLLLRGWRMKSRANSQLLTSTMEHFPSNGSSQLDEAADDIDMQSGRFRAWLYFLQKRALISTKYASEVKVKPKKSEKVELLVVNVDSETNSTTSSS